MFRIISLCLFFTIVASQSTAPSTTADVDDFVIEDITKAKAHGCLMVIAWVLFASTGILIARYFRTLFPNTQLCGIEFWFLLHRPIMLVVTALSITGFLVILSWYNWKWISPDDHLEFAHSIFGIITIAVAVIQPLIGVLRCGKDHEYRFAFNYVHRSIGVFGLVCSIVALYLGVLIEELNLGDNGWGLITGWAVWSITLPCFLEMVELYLPPKSSNYQVSDEQAAILNRKRKRAEFIKKMLLVLHLIVALAFTVALVVIIGMAEPPEE